MNWSVAAILSFCTALLFAFAMVHSQTSVADSFRHNPHCRNIKPAEDIGAQNCLSSHLGKKSAQIEVIASSDEEAFDALRQILESFRNRENALAELDYADFVGVARGGHRLSYFLMDAGEFVTPRLVLDVNERDLGIFFPDLMSDPSVFNLKTDQFDLKF